MANTMQTTAVLAHEPSTPFQHNFAVSQVTLTKPEPGPNEVLVKTIASGICHSDVHVGGVPSPFLGQYPKVLGHEGAGHILAVGSGVSGFQVGDPVLLSYTYCGVCDLCKDDHPAYCLKFNEENAFCEDKIWRSEKGESVGGKFFGQSSWAGMTIVDAKSLVNVKGLLSGDEELKLCSPLGCGLMTGSGAVVNTAKAGPKDVVLITGLGAVGLGALMAAKIAGCKGIIAVDRVASRLALAQELGATGVIDTSKLAADKNGDFSEEAQKIAGEGVRITYIFETTGVTSVMNSGFKSLGKRGCLVQIGIPKPGSEPMPLDTNDFFGNTKRMEMNFLGEALAQDHVPKMIGWWKEGKFPFEKMVKFYKLEDVNQAVDDMHGSVIKPILVH